MSFIPKMTPLYQVKGVTPAATVAQPMGRRAGERLRAEPGTLALIRCATVAAFFFVAHPSCRHQHAKTKHEAHKKVGRRKHFVNSPHRKSYNAKATTSHAHSKAT